MSEDIWPRRYRNRNWWPFTRRYMFEDVDDMFKEMEDFMENQFKDISQKAPKNLIRERTLPNGRKVKEWGPFVYGYSVTVDPNGRPQVREFGNMKPENRMGRPQINLTEQREPLIDVIESDNQVNIIAELPGIEKKDIKLNATENTLTISVDTPQRKYYKEIELPTPTNPKQAKSTYKNGVLEVTLQKQKEKQPKGQQIKIE